MGLIRCRRPDEPTDDMTTATEHHSVLAWRTEQFLALGFSEEEADRLAAARDVELSQVRKLVASGAPLELIARIVL